MKRAFALAPRPNPDGTPGINLHVDVGTLVDSDADEAGLAGTCSNGVDDDGADTACRHLDSNSEVVPGNCGNGVDDDGQIDGNAAADAGASVSPTWLETSQVALVHGERRALDDQAIISCRTRGKHVYDFTHGLDPARSPDTDPDSSNDKSRASLTVG